MPNDADRTSEALLAVLPSAIAKERGQHEGGRGVIEFQTLRDMQLNTCKRATRVESGGGACDDGTGGSTTALYAIDYPATEVVIDGVFKRFAAGVDQVLIGAGQDIVSYDLAGAAAVVIPTNDNDAKFVVVAVLVSGVPTLFAIFGAVAGTGAAVAPTTAQIRTALLAAGIANADETVCLPLFRGTAARGTDAVAITGVDPASDDALRAEQVVGTLLGV